MIFDLVVAGWRRGGCYVGSAISGNSWGTFRGTIAALAAVVRAIELSVALLRVDKMENGEVGS